MSKETYPLISYKLKGSSEVKEISFDSSLAKTIPYPVYIRGGECGDDFIEDAIKYVNNGAVVLWIENTIQEAQRIYDIVSNKLSSDCVGLLHSRYTSEDRGINEKLWIDRLGKGGSRSGCILISTQVCEQSIDIDADILFTSLCPIDFLIQRIGRIWRHRYNDSKRTIEAPMVFWFSSDLRKDAQNVKNKSGLYLFQKVYGKSSYVYAPYYLMRTMDLLVTKKYINIPDDIRDLLEWVYSDSRDYPYFKKLVEDKKGQHINIAREVLNKSSVFRTTKYDSIEDDATLAILDDPVDNKLGTRIGDGSKKICLLDIDGEHTIHGKLFFPNSRKIEDKRAILEATITLSAKTYKNVSSYIKKDKYVDSLIMKRVRDIYLVYDGSTGKDILSQAYSSKKGWYE